MSDTPRTYAAWHKAMSLAATQNTADAMAEHSHILERELAAMTEECAELRSQLEAASKRPTKYEDKPYIPSHDRDGFGG
jgi:ubiquinone biosynthesis protein UbiJ